MFGERFKQLRKERKIPQQQLADVMGVKLRAYQGYETEAHEPGIKGFIALADFYGVSLDYLVGRTDDPK